MAEGEYGVAEKGRIGGRHIAEELDAEIVEDDVERGAGHGDVHGELVLVVEKFDVGEGRIHEGKDQAHGHRGNDVDRLVVLAGRQDQHDLRGKGGKDEGAGRDARKDQEEDVVQLPEFLLFQLLVLPGDQGIVDALGDDLHDEAGIVGDTIEARRSHADHLLHHDPVKLVQDVLGDIVHEQGEVEDDGEFRVFLFEPDPGLFSVVDKEADAEAEIDEDAGKDAGIALLLGHQDGRDTQDGVEDRHQQGPEDDRLIDILVALADGPEVDGRRKHELHEYGDHNKGRELGQGIDLPAEDQVDQKEAHGQAQRDRLHGGGIGVPVLPELAHALVEHSVIEPEGDKDREDLQPGIVDGELAVLLRGHQPGEDRQSQHGYAFLQDTADYKPYGGLGGDRDRPVSVQQLIDHDGNFCIFLFITNLYCWMHTCAEHLCLAKLLEDADMSLENRTCQPARGGQDSGAGPESAGKDCPTGTHAFGADGSDVSCQSHELFPQLLDPHVKLSPAGPSELQALHLPLQPCRRHGGPEVMLFHIGGHEGLAVSVPQGGPA